MRAMVLDNFNQHDPVQNTLGTCGCQPQVFVENTCRRGFYCTEVPDTVENGADYDGCAVECQDDEIFCPPKTDPFTGCKEEALCVPKSIDNNGNLCPEGNECPTDCPPGSVYNPDKCVC